MLHLKLSPGDYIMIGDDIIVQMAYLSSSIVVSIDAPRELRIIRGEHYEKEAPTPDCVRWLWEEHPPRQIDPERLLKVGVTPPPPRRKNQIGRYFIDFNDAPPETD